MKDYYSLIPKNKSVPPEADFCFIMTADCMEPVINKGETVYVSRKASPRELEVGLFMHWGKVYCRQFCEDYAGNLHLLCANPLRESENLCLDRQQQQQLICLGKVLLGSKPPMPIYK